MTTKELISFADIPLFSGLAPDVLGQLYSSCNTRKLEPREVLFREGEHGSNMYIVSSGKMRVWVTTPSGHDLELVTLGSNEVLGELEIFDGKPRSASAQALEYTVLVAVPRESIFEAIGRSPGVAIHLIRILSARLRQNNYMRVQELSENKLAQRLARLLLMMGENMPNYKIPKFNNERVVELLETDPHMTRELLHDLASEGLISLENGSGVTLLDVNQLHQLAD